MPSPSLNRPLYLDRGFGRDFSNRTAFMAVGGRQSTDLHPFIGMIGTSAFTQRLWRWAAVNVSLHPMPVFLRARPQQPGPAIVPAGWLFFHAIWPFQTCNPLAPTVPQPAHAAGPSQVGWSHVVTFFLLL